MGIDPALGPYAPPPYHRISDTGLEACVFRGLVWIRGPCGEHALSLASAQQLGLWLLVTHRDATLEGTAEDVTDRSAIGFGDR